MGCTLIGPPMWHRCQRSHGKLLLPGSLPKDPDEALYAQLYWSYDSLEQDDIKLFDDSGAIWPIMKTGFAKLREQHPHSDHILNAAARFACIADDGDAYRALRPLLENHISATIWSEKISLESCDRQLAAQVPLWANPRRTRHTRAPRLSSADLET
jgi:hypothetical protein